jgi:hypothetical protein
VKVIKSNITYHQIEVKDSSIGYGVHVGPGDLIILNATASHVTHVTINIVQPTFDHTKLVSSMKAKVIIIAGHIISFGAFFCTLIPSYELWINVSDPNSIWFAIAALACVLALQIRTMDQRF